MHPFVSLSILFAVFSHPALARDHSGDGRSVINKEIKNANDGEALTRGAAAAAVAAEASDLGKLFKTFEDADLGAAKNAFGDEMKPLQNELKEVGHSLLGNVAEDVDKDSGVKKSVDGDWNVKSRERIVKHHKNGVENLKAGVSQVKDMDKKDKKAHEVRKVALAVSGSDPAMEKNGSFFRSVSKSQMVKKEWESGASGGKFGENPAKNFINGGFLRNHFFGGFADRLLDSPFVARSMEALVPARAASLVQPNRQNEGLVDDDSLFLQSVKAKVMNGLEGDAKEKFRRVFDAAVAERRAADAVESGNVMATDDIRRLADDAFTGDAFRGGVWGGNGKRAMGEEGLGAGAAFDDGDAAIPWRDVRDLRVFRRRPTFFIH